MARKDPEARKAYQRAYYQANKERIDAQKRAWAEENKDRVQERLRVTCAAWQKANKERVAARSTAWRAANPERWRQVQADWVRRNPEAGRAKQALRRAAIKNATPAWHGELDEFVLQEAAHLCVLREGATKIKWHIDHDVPLRGEVVSGLHVWNNFRVLPAAVNVRKGNSFPLDVNT